MAELKSCPFCGGNAVLDQFVEDGIYHFSITCTRCYIWTGFYDNRNDVIERWNRRVNAQVKK